MQHLVERLSQLLENNDTILSVSESCTGGLICAAITERPGSSRIFDRGFITYSNEAKMELLGVPSDLLAEHGAVSEQCAIAMALGVIKHSKAGASISVTGIAGPDGGSQQKPVGLVYIGAATAHNNAISCRELHLSGSRAEIRQQAAKAALQNLIDLIEQQTELA